MQFWQKFPLHPSQCSSGKIQKIHWKIVKTKMEKVCTKLMDWTYKVLFLWMYWSLLQRHLMLSIEVASKSKTPTPMEFLLNLHLCHRKVFRALKGFNPNPAVKSLLSILCSSTDLNIDKFKHQQMPSSTFLKYAQYNS